MFPICARNSETCETGPSETRHSQSLFSMVRILMSGLITFAIWKKRRPRKRGHIWFLQAIVLALLELSFMSLIPASAEQTPSTATQELVKNVDQLQAVLQSLQQRIDGIQSFLTQSADNLEKRAQEFNTNLEKRSGDIKEEIVDLKAKNKQKKPDPFFAPSSLPSWVIITDIGIFLLAAAAVAITAVLWRGQSGARKKQHNESDAAFHNRKDGADRCDSTVQCRTYLSNCSLGRSICAAGACKTC